MHLLRCSLLVCILFVYYFARVQGLGNETAITAQSNTLRADQQSIAFNDAYGNFLNVYVATTIGAGSNPDQTSIMGQVLTVDGNLVVKSFTIIAQGTYPGFKSSPVVALSRNDNRYLVVFEYDASGTGSADIWGAWVTADGTTAIIPFQISNHTEDERNPSVAWNSDDNVFAIVWDINMGANRMIAMVTITSTTFQTSEVTFGLDTSSSNQQPFVVYDSGEQYYVVLFAAHLSNSDGLDDIFTVSVTTSAGSSPQLVVSTVVNTVGVIEVNQTTGRGTHARSKNPSVVGNNPYFLLWEVIGQSGEDYIAGMYVNEVGRAISDLVGVGVSGYLDRNPAALYSSGASIYVVVYESGPRTGPNSNIVALTLDYNLNILQSYDINQVYTNNDRHPVIAGDGVNRNMIVWYHGQTHNPPPPPPNNGTGARREQQAASAAFADDDSTTFIKRESQSEMRARTRESSRRASTHYSSESANRPLPFAPPSSPVEEVRAVESFLESRAVPPTPPAFLVGNPLVVIPYTSSSGTSTNGKKSSEGWVGGLVAIILIVVAIIVTSLVVVVLLVYVIYKYRDQLQNRLANLRMPNVRRGNFQQFTDEDEVPGL